jgi:hypothetical protein
VLLSRRRVTTVRIDEFAAAKQHALDAHVSQLRRPSVIPSIVDWKALPTSVLSAAAAEVEIFVPWYPVRR